jgi:uncharacterized membrane protein YphA (DoxX/SURF4 family)
MPEEETTMRRFFQELFQAHVDSGALVLRLGLAAIFIVHGFLKLVQDGGAGWNDDLPRETQMAVAWGETVCGGALLLGFLSRLAAVGIIVMQTGAISLYTWRFDFVHIEYNRANPLRVPTGTEYNFALIIMCLAVIAIGSGKASLDHFLFGRRRKATPAP